VRRVGRAKYDLACIDHYCLLEKKALERSFKTKERAENRVFKSIEELMYLNTN